MIARQFVAELSEVQLPDVFNPYADVCESHDAGDAPRIRRGNLETILRTAMLRGVDSIWVGRELGYRGGRRTGLALTDEAHLASHASIFGCCGLARATRGPAVSERTAGVIWDRLVVLRRPIFLWNVFPFHSHRSGEPMTNRCHTRAERLASRHYLAWLMRTLEPRHVVAIGRDAQAAMHELGIASEGVRHPSYGGRSEFIAGLNAIYGLPDEARGVEQLALAV